MLEQSLVVTGLEAPGQSQLSSKKCNELLTTTVRTLTVAQSWGKSFLFMSL